MEEIHREFKKKRPEPSLEDKIKFITYAHDPLIFIKEFNYGFDSEELKYKLLKIHDFQIGVLKNIHNNNAIIKKSRQMYISQLTAAYCAWNILFKEDFNIAIVGNNKEASNRIIERIKIILQNFTIIFNYEQDVVTNNVSEIRLANGSFVRAFAPSSNAGRGYSINMLIIDEADFIKEIEDIWIGLGMALSCTGGKCIMISTPNKIDFFHRIWQDAINNTNDFIPIHLDWKMNPNYTKDLEIRNQQCWSSWYENMCNSLGWDEDKINKELNGQFVESNKSVQTRINFRVNEELYYKIMNKIGNKISMSDYLRELIEKDLNEK